MNASSAAFQKLQKLDLIDLDDSPDPIISPSLLSDLNSIISTLHSALLNAKLVKYSTNPLYSSASESIGFLKHLVTSLCTALEYTELPKQPKQKENYSSFGALKKMMRAPADGVYLKQTECKEICSVLIGDLRDNGNYALKEKVVNLQRDIVKYAKCIHELRIEVENKQKEIEYLYESIDNLNAEICMSLVKKTRFHVSHIKGKFSGDSTTASIGINQML